MRTRLRQNFGRFLAIGRLASRSAAGATAGGGGRTRTYEGVSQRIYSPPPLPLGTLPRTSHPRGCVGRAGLWGARRAVSTAPHPPAPAPKNSVVDLKFLRICGELVRNFKPKNHTRVISLLVSL